jgi:DNA invertase Pin-like site-specific DNA recombinase
MLQGGIGWNFGWLWLERLAGEFEFPLSQGTSAVLQVLEDAEHKKTDILLTHQLHRFFRNVQLQLETLGGVGIWGVGHLSFTEQIDYSTPQGVLFVGMLGALSEHYVASLSRETKKGKKGRAHNALKRRRENVLGQLDCLRDLYVAETHLGAIPGAPTATRSRARGSERGHARNPA